LSPGTPRALEVSVRAARRDEERRKRTDHERESVMKNTNVKSSRRRRQGQGMTEYIIIVGLIAILLVAAVTKFKEKLNDSYMKAAGAIDTEITQKLPGGG
jgi:Flp pilus assembly pilin Flp